MLYIGKSKGEPRQAEVALGVLGRLRPRIFSTFGTKRVAGRQPNSPTPFTPGEMPGTHFQRLSRPQGIWFCLKEPRKKSQVTQPGIDPGTVRLVAQLPQAPVHRYLHKILMAISVIINYAKRSVNISY